MTLQRPDVRDARAQEEGWDPLCAPTFQPMPEEAEGPDVLKAKICLVGEQSVGKTCLVSRFVLGDFPERYVPTLGAQVTKKEVVAHVGGRPVRTLLTIWDIMGEPSFRKLLRDAYIANSQGILAVADVTRPSTVETLPEWIEAAREVCGPVPVVMLMNKADLLPPDATRRKADSSEDIPCRWASAKTGENVAEAFALLVERVASAAAESTRTERGA